jgi:SAM-dependent methyltransferase
VTSSKVIMKTTSILQTPQGTSAAHDLFDTLQTDEPYWANYLLARPTYSSSFYELLRNYRAAHAKDSSSAFELAHDVGTGPGQNARVLATTQYAKVVATDASPAHVDVARQLNKDLEQAGRLQLHPATGEEVADTVPELLGKADGVFCAEAIPLMDAPRAVAGWAELLKSGGISATWFYGRPAFVNNDKANAIYAKIVNRLFAPMIARFGPKERQGWLRATSLMHGWLDGVAFPADTWEHVERIKWNTSFTMDFYDLDVCGVAAEVDGTSAVTQDEKVEERVDPNFWEAYWTATDVRRFIEVNLPKFWEGRAEVRDEELEALYVDLGEALGGKEVKAKIGWPVSLLLATKK